MIMTRPLRPARVSSFLHRFVLPLAVAAVVLGLAAPRRLKPCAIKDIASFSGVRDNQLVGYGLVIGLGGTGDSRDAFTSDALSNMMERMGVALDPSKLKARNVASVMVTANLPCRPKRARAST